MAHPNQNIVAHPDQHSLQACRYCDRPVVAAFAEECNTIVFAGAAVLVVLVVAPQDFPHKWSYVLVVPNDLKNLSIAAGAASEMMLRDIDFKVQAVENIMHGNVEM